MEIYIPSRGRPNDQRTAVALSQADIPFELVCSANDPKLGQYRAQWGEHVKVIEALSIMDKRQQIFRRAKGKLLMLDDDLRFYARKDDKRFETITPGGLRRMINWFERALEDNAHAGLCDKFMSQHRSRGVSYQGRYNQALAYNKELIWARAKERGKEMPRFRLPLNQEHDMHLQLLALGLSPAICCEFSKDAKYYAPGGLSNFRTPDVERKIFNELARLWPEHVKLRATRHSICGIAATFNWKKATQDGAR